MAALDNKKRTVDDALYDGDDILGTSDPLADVKIKRQRSSPEDDDFSHKATNGAVNYSSPSDSSKGEKNLEGGPNHDAVNDISKIYNHGQGVVSESDEESSPKPPPIDQPAIATTSETEFAGARPPAEVQQTKQSDELTREQLRFCGNVLRSVKRLKDARPFLEPVDPIKLNIPTYLEIIKRPMDLSTIERKLKGGQYSDAQGFIDDIRLMFENCYTFNTRESPVGQCGVNLERSFDKYMEKMPTKSKSDRNKKKSSNQELIDQAPETPWRMGAADPRPKREIHPPSKDIPTPANTSSARNSLSSKSRLNDPDLRFCSEVLRELNKKQHAVYSYPFLTPVDPIALNIPHYREIIKHPMDLSTMRRKLDDGEYRSSDEFRADAKLMFNNCYTFNPPGTEVHTFGKKLEEVFDRKWKEKPSPGSPVPARIHRTSKTKSKAQLMHDEYSSSDEDEEDDTVAKQIQLLQQQVNVITEQIQMLQEKRARRKLKRKSVANLAGAPPSKTAKSTKPKTKPSTPSTQAKKTATKKSSEKLKQRRRVDYSSDEDSSLPDLTYDQKAELSELVGELPPHKVDKVMEIIRSGSGLPDTTDQGEIELDIESLTKGTLWKLYKFVKGNAAKPRKVGSGRAMDSSSNESQSGSDSGDESE